MSTARDFRPLAIGIPCFDSVIDWNAGRSTLPHNPINRKRFGKINTGPSWALVDSDPGKTFSVIEPPVSQVVRMASLVFQGKTRRVGPGSVCRQCDVGDGSRALTGPCFQFVQRRRRSVMSRFDRYTDRSCFHGLEELDLLFGFDGRTKAK